MSSSPLTRLLCTAFAVALALVPGEAWACAVCFSGEEANRLAYIGTTAFLTFFPLIMVGCSIYIVRRHIVRRTRELEEAEATGLVSNH
jgi:hypothetical protein